MAPFFPQQMNAGLQQVGQTPSSYLTGGLARGVSEYNSYERSLAATPMASVHRPLYPSFVPSQFKSYGNIQRPQMPVGHSRVYTPDIPLSLPKPWFDGIQVFGYQRIEPKGLQGDCPFIWSNKLWLWNMTTLSCDKNTVFNLSHGFGRCSMFWS